MRNLQNLIFAVAFVFFLPTTTEVKSQGSKLDYRPLTFNVNFGQTLFWGDMNDEILNPFNYYFSKTYSDYAFGLIVQKNVTAFLAFDVQYTNGHWKGQRTTWSDGNDANLNFRTSYHSFMANVDIDILNLILKDKVYRPFNFYIRGGFGYDLVNANKYATSDGSLVENYKGGSMQVPWGWGVRYDINKTMGITFENTFHHSLADVLDAHDSQFTDFNDLNAYTSLGFSYRIYPKPRKPRIDENNIPVDTQITVAVEKPEPKINANIKMASSVFSNDTVECVVTINNELVSESAKLQITLPNGFSANDIKSSADENLFDDQILSVKWNTLDSSTENYNIKFNIISKDVPQNSYSIPGIVFYNVDGVEKTFQFKSTFNVKPVPVAVAVNNQPIDTKPVEVALTQPTEQSDIEYRVQIKAIYGGKSSPSQIQKQYKVTTEVYEEYQNGYTKYTTGKYSSYEEAKKLKDELRAKNVPGAFVVAYHKGSRVNNITEAISMENKVKETQPQSPSNQPVVAGVTYSIQVAASGRNLSPESLKNQFGISDELKKTTHNGLYKYMIGPFNSHEEASKKLESLKGNIPDAFIVKFVDGKRQ